MRVGTDPVISVLDNWIGGGNVILSEHWLDTEVVLSQHQLDTW